jgi:hypothetical protein
MKSQQGEIGHKDGGRAKNGQRSLTVMDHVRGPTKGPWRCPNVLTSNGSQNICFPEGL